MVTLTGLNRSNSVSGAYRSITRMALEFAGINDIPCNEQKGEKHLKQEVNLFLPEYVTQ